MNFLSGNKYSQNYYGNIYNIDKEIFNKKTLISKFIKNLRYNFRGLKIIKNRSYIILRLCFFAIYTWIDRNIQT